MTGQARHVVTGPAAIADGQGGFSIETIEVDPKLVPDAKKFDRLTFDEVLDMKLGVMDLTAICLVRDHDIPVRVFNMNKPGALLNNVMGSPDGTILENPHN